MKNDKTFSLLAILTIPLCVSINFVGGQVATVLKLPVYLDAIGTIFAGMLCGPVVGIVTGIVTTLVESITNPTNLPFVVSSIATGWLAGELSKHNLFQNYFRTGISTFLLSLIAIATSTPVVVLLYGGVTGGGSSLFTGAAMAMGVGIWKSVIGVEGFFTLVDRLISVVLCMLVMKIIPERNIVMYRFGDKYLPRDANKNRGV